MQKQIDMSKASFLVNGSNYNLTEDKRLLIPYIQNGKTGLVTNRGEIKIEACYYDKENKKDSPLFFTTVVDRTFLP